MPKRLTFDLDDATGYAGSVEFLSDEHGIFKPEHQPTIDLLRAALRDRRLVSMEIEGVQYDSLAVLAENLEV